MEASEKQIERAILDHLNTWAGCFAWKNQSTAVWDPKKRLFRKPSKYQISGVSDIICLTSNGIAVFIEVKSKKGRISKDQELFLDKIEDHNGFAFVARSVDEVIDYFKRHGL